MTKDDIIKLADKYLVCQIEGYEVSGVFDFARAVYDAGRTEERKACSRVRAKKPRELPSYGTGALWDEQQYCFEKGWKEGVASIRSSIRTRGA